jgi:heptosyltransferase-2
LFGGIYSRQGQAMKILIIGPAWVGDMVMAQGLFMALKQMRAEAQIDVIAPDWTRALLERMPEVSQIFSLPFKHGEFSLTKRFSLGKTLQKERYNEAIVLPNSWKSALIPFAARIPKRTGWLGEMRFGLLNHIFYLDKKKYPLMVERFIALTGEKLPIFHPKLTVKPATQTLQKFNITTDKPLVALCPGAEFGPSKRWPENYYAEVARYLLEKNKNVLLMGSQKDDLITSKINEFTQNRCYNLAGKTTLGEAIDLMAQTSQVITNDSGLMHIAAALNKPLIAIYGSTDPNFTPPLTDNAKILSITLDCRPCFQRECPLKHHRCMNDLPPQRVIEVLDT